MEEEDQRGCMTVFYTTAISSKQLSASLRDHGIVTDVRTWKNIDVVRVAFVPLYNSFQELYTFIVTLHQLLSHEGK
jgi:kynureninase